MAPVSDWDALSPRVAGDAQRLFSKTRDCPGERECKHGLSSEPERWGVVTPVSQEARVSRPRQDLWIQSGTSPKPWSRLSQSTKLQRPVWQEMTPGYLSIRQ